MKLLHDFVSVAFLSPNPRSEKGFQGEGNQRTLNKHSSLTDSPLQYKGKGRIKD